MPFEDEDEFDENAPLYEALGYKCYYFGETGDAPTDGSMRTGRTTVDLGGDSFTFYFETSGGDKGAGVTGEEDDRYYQSGKLLAAGSDERYQVVERYIVEGTEDDEEPVYAYRVLDDVDEFFDRVRDRFGNEAVWNVPLSNYDENQDMGDIFGISNMNQDASDLDELYVFYGEEDAAVDDNVALDTDDFFLVNTSGRVVDGRGRSRDGNDYYFVTDSQGRITAVYLED